MCGEREFGAFALEQFERENQESAVADPAIRPGDTHPYTEAANSLERRRLTNYARGKMRIPAA